MDYQYLAISLIEAVEAADEEQVGLILSTAAAEEGGPIRLLSALAGVAAVAINSHQMEVPDFATLYREQLADNTGKDE